MLGVLEAGIVSQGFCDILVCVVFDYLSFFERKDFFILSSDIDVFNVVTLHVVVLCLCSTLFFPQIFTLSGFALGGRNTKELLLSPLLSFVYSLYLFLSIYDQSIFSFVYVCPILFVVTQRSRQSLYKKK